MGRATELSQEDLEKAERTGFPIVALILIAVFGSLAAAALPLALGGVAVIITGAIIFLLSQQMEMSVFVTNMASMIGIGVAVDYSLFILARFRESVRAGNAAPADARAEALATSGLAVAFSGLAVIISLAGLWMVQNQALRSMALGRDGRGRRRDPGRDHAAARADPAPRPPGRGRRRRLERDARRPQPLWRKRRRPGSTNPDRETFWERWTARGDGAAGRLRARRRRRVLLTLAIPVLAIETGNGAARSSSPTTTTRASGTELAAEATGGGGGPDPRARDASSRATVERPRNARPCEDFSAEAAAGPRGRARSRRPVAGAATRP